jgi:hypothetical protein
MFTLLCALIAPIVIFAVSIPFTGRLSAKLRMAYILGGTAILLVGTPLAVYFSLYGGDQGGVTAFYLYVAVLVTYGVFSLLILTGQWFSKLKKR